MRNTCQMKKYGATVITVTVLAAMLAGCTKTDSTQNGAAGASNTGVNASGNVVAGAGNTAPENKQPVSETAVSSDAAQSGEAQNTPAQNVSGTTTQAQGSTGDGGSQSAPQANASSSGGSQSSASQSSAAQTKAASEDFTGKFVKSDGTESVQITKASDSQVTFVFKTSKINGSAKADGGTAVYYGDDDYSITLDVAEDTLIVTVDGDGAGESQMNGIYYRDLGDDDDEDDNPAFDADETED